LADTSWGRNDNRKVFKNLDRLKARQKWPWNRKNKRITPETKNARRNYK